MWCYCETNYNLNSVFQNKSPTTKYETETYISD